MDCINLNIAKDFSKTPGPRFIIEGDFSGELFRDSILLTMVSKAIEESKKLRVYLDGTAGYATSFLEESFGGLIRVHNIDYKKIISILEIICEEDEKLVKDIYNYLKEAQDEKLRG